MSCLYSYRVRVDAGSAPNPYGGYCTLVICKPKIRATAKVGDWIVGTGSSTSPIGDASGKVIYAMQVTEVMSMREYDSWAREHCPDKFPDIRSREPHGRLGDCLYDYSNGGEQPTLRWGVHKQAHMEHDLSGLNALISSHFYYFGNNALELPLQLRGIIKKGPGHKSKMNDILFGPFVDWIHSLNLPENTLHGDPSDPITGRLSRAAARSQSGSTEL